MIRPRKKKARLRRFLSFDLEWSKGSKVPSVSFNCDVWRPRLRMVGVYDGERYRYYRTVEQFFDGELTHRNRGKWFYAHAGGLADMAFLLEYLADNPDYSVDASFSGSSAIIVHIKRGRMKWTFVDSLWLIRKSLADIAKSIGMAKGDIESFDAPFAELVEYNELDCVILWKAIHAFQARLLSLGGELQMTQASSAMWLFRKRFLKQEIMTSPGLNKIARNAYFASRVEPFKTGCRDAFYYDINSSFPHAMTFDCPGNLIGTGRKWNEDKLSIVEATVSVPSDCYFPPVPKRYKQSVFFPVGTWRGHFTGTDLELLLETGGRVRKVHEALTFDSFDGLTGYAETLYEMRRKTTDEVDRLVLKLLLNSLYGKFAELSEKTSLMLHPDKTPEVPDANRNGNQRKGIVDVDMLFAGAYIVTKEVKVKHCHVPISVQITSRARAALYRYMKQAGEFYYCDTDGFCAKRPDIPTTDALGGLKKEQEVGEGVFLRPKVYRLDDRVRAKGFTLKPDRTELVFLKDGTEVPLEKLPKEEQKRYTKEYEADRFIRLMNGEAITMRRFGRVRETFSRAGGPEDIYPTERTISKRLRSKARTKRKWLKGGNSRPWHVRELEV